MANDIKYLEDLEGYHLQRQFEYNVESAQAWNLEQKAIIQEIKAPSIASIITTYEVRKTTSLNKKH